MTVGGTTPRLLVATPLAVPPCALGESPRWAHGAWWWVDADAGTVWTAAGTVWTAGAARSVFQSSGRVSLVQPAADGLLVVASGTELLVLDPASGRTTPWSRVELPPGWVLNDGTADETGRLWVGSVHPERRAGAGALYVVERDGSVRAVATGTTLSNGMAWRTPRTLVHADSLERCLWEHLVEPSTARVLHSRRAVRVPKRAAEFAGGSGGIAPLALPDGIAIDVAGGLWVAMYGTGQVWRLADGRVDTVLEVPTARVTSVALGGCDGLDLLVTTAQEGMDAADLASDPAAGRLFRGRAAVPGPVLPVLRPGVTTS